MDSSILDYISPVRIVKHMKEFSCILDDVKCGSQKVVENLNANGVKIDEYRAQRQRKPSPHH